MDSHKCKQHISSLLRSWTQTFKCKQHISTVHGLVQVYATDRWLVLFMHSFKCKQHIGSLPRSWTRSVSNTSVVRFHSQAPVQQIQHTGNSLTPFTTTTLVQCIATHWSCSSFQSWKPICGQQIADSPEAFLPVAPHPPRWDSWIPVNFHEYLQECSKAASHREFKSKSY